MVKLSMIVLACVLSLDASGGAAKENTQRKNPKVVHVCKKNDSQIDALACNIYQESRGEGLSGQLAVGFVTINRLKSSNYPTSIHKVVYQTSQFSWTNYRGPYKITEENSWQVARDIAKLLYKIRDNTLLYDKLDPTYGSTHYHTKNVRPYWRVYFQKTVVIDNHIFYKERSDG